MTKILKNSGVRSRVVHLLPWKFWGDAGCCERPKPHKYHISRLHHTKQHRLSSASRRSRRIKQSPYNPMLHRILFQQYKHNKGNPWICNWTCPSDINHVILVHVMLIGHWTVNVPRAMFEGRKKKHSWCTDPLQRTTIINVILQSVNYKSRILRK